GEGAGPGRHPRGGGRRPGPRASRIAGPGGAGGISPVPGAGSRRGAPRRVRHVRCVRHAVPVTVGRVGGRRIRHRVPGGGGGREAGRGRALRGGGGGGGRRGDRPVGGGRRDQGGGFGGGPATAG